MKREENDNYKIMFSIYDNVSELYEAPFVDINKGTALRRVNDLMTQNPTSPYAKFPDNFVLTSVGLWNDKTGYIFCDKAEVIMELNQITQKE
tara:strand:+ start:3320 stop:3595 length:276 start_codon:yes stop_codon:yes gene_type:complete